jgi:hypothetical protein
MVDLLSVSRPPPSVTTSQMPTSGQLRSQLPLRERRTLPRPNRQQPQGSSYSIVDGIARFERALTAEGS